MTSEQKTQVRQWFAAAIPILRAANNKARGLDTDKYRGVHVVYGGLNQRFRAKFAGLDPKECMQELEHDQFLAVIPARGGAMVYLFKDKPDSYHGPAADPTVLDKAIDDQIALMEADAILASENDLNEPTEENTSPTVL
ncbi:MAG: hypothetical protein WC773_04595 [Patescibacteria group bacterium]|jgi:hypothetical protein